MSWEDAKTQAEADGGYLATLTSALENDFVWTLVASFAAQIQADTQEFWLGGYQTSYSDEPAGNWAWVTGETWDYTNWAAGEPNNGVGGTQHYLHFCGKWIVG